MPENKKCCFLINLELGVVIGAIVSVVASCYCLYEFPMQAYYAMKFSLGLSLYYAYFAFTALLVIGTSLYAIYGVCRNSSEELKPSRIIAVKIYCLAITFIFYILESKALKFKIMYDEGIFDNLDETSFVDIHYQVFKTKLILVIKVALLAGLDFFFRFLPIESLFNQYEGKQEKVVDAETGEVETFEVKTGEMDSVKTDKVETVKMDTDKVGTVIETEKPKQNQSESVKPESIKPVPVKLESAEVEPRKESSQV